MALLTLPGEQGVLIHAGYEEGGGWGTTCPRSFFAAGSTVATAPPRGAAGYEEGGGLETTNPSSSFAAGVTVAGAPQRGVSELTTSGEKGQPCRCLLELTGCLASRVLSGAMRTNSPCRFCLPNPRECQSQWDAPFGIPSEDQGLCTTRM
ncbi:UNVERIFIED_CONTAM: hypothetical protein FKN15_013252 [Acipenser sinensis]